MNDVDLILGELKEHKQATDNRLDRIENKIDGLQAWRWKKVGETGVISAIVAFLVYLIIGK